MLAFCKACPFEPIGAASVGTGAAAPLVSIAGQAARRAVWARTVVVRQTSVLRTLATDDDSESTATNPQRRTRDASERHTKAPVAAKPTSATRGASGPRVLAPQQGAIQRDKLTHPRGVGKTA